MTDTTARRFPILLPRLVTPLEREAAGLFVPWDFLAPFQRNALNNHGQNLERLAARGGLSWGEIHAVIQGRGWTSIPRGPDAVAQAEQAVRAAVAAWEATR